MVHSASLYGLGDGLPPMRGGRDLAYDTYVEQARTRAAAQASVAFQALQTGLLNQMSQSMNAVYSEMAEVRQQQGEALAIQQELLNREQMQSHLEEFIFQAEKLIAECSKTTTDIPPSSRYFLLMGVQGKIENDGISTAIIRGRDNKTAFENVLASANDLTQRLLKEPEVQQAVKWAEAERKRLEAEHQRSEREREAKIQKLEQHLAKLQTDLKAVTAQDVLSQYWTGIKTGVLSKPENKTGLTVALVVGICLLWPLLIFAVPLALPILAITLHVKAKQRTAELNQTTEAEIATVSQQLADLRR